MKTVIARQHDGKVTIAVEGEQSGEAVAREYLKVLDIINPTTNVGKVEETIKPPLKPKKEEA